jgi:RNA polymerase sigma-70 factor (ECF subfamily)
MPGTDRELVERILARDADTFNRCFDRWAPLVRRRLLRLLRDPSTAEDLLQEAFLRLWTRAGQWDGRGTLRGWLVAVATNLARNHLRALRRRPVRRLELPSTDEEDEDMVPGWMVDQAAVGPPEAAERAETRRRVRRMVDQLTEDKREALRLVYEEQMDLGAAAYELDVPRGTVKSRLFYARRELAEKLRDTEGG